MNIFLVRRHWTNSTASQCKPLNLSTKTTPLEPPWFGCNDGWWPQRARHSNRAIYQGCDESYRSIAEYHRFFNTPYLTQLRVDSSPNSNQHELTHWKSVIWLLERSLNAVLSTQKTLQEIRQQNNTSYLELRDDARLRARRHLWLSDWIGTWRRPCKLKWVNPSPTPPTTPRPQVLETLRCRRCFVIQLKINNP